MRYRLTCLIAGVLILPATAAGQVLLRPTPEPLVTAAGADWLQARTPILFAGDLYYPAGATRFFDGNVMVLSGSYQGVPLYTDATVEPYSLVFVPVGRGLLQPYERLRAGELAGTTGSRTPSFPVQTTGEALRGVGASGRLMDLDGIGVESTTGAPSATGEGENVGPRALEGPLQTAYKPTGRNAVWIVYEGREWESDGAAVAVGTGALPAGEYHGFTVYRDPQLPGRILVEVGPGLAAPYRLVN